LLITKKAIPSINLKGPIRDAYFSNDGQRVITFTESAIIEVWDTETGQAVKEQAPNLFAPFIGPAWRDRRQSAVSLPYIFETENYNTVLKHKSDQSRVSENSFPSAFDHCFSISPDARFIADGDSSGRLKILDVKAEKWVNLIGHNSSMNNHMHQNSIEYLEFDRHSQLLLSISEEESCPRLWPDAGAWAETVNNGHVKNSIVFDKPASLARFSPTASKLLLANPYRQSLGLHVDVYDYSL